MNAKVEREYDGKWQGYVQSPHGIWVPLEIALEHRSNVVQALEYWGFKVVPGDRR
jgi:hypothetical protein